MPKLNGLVVWAVFGQRAHPAYSSIIKLKRPECYRKYSIAVKLIFRGVERLARVVRWAEVCTRSWKSRNIIRRDLVGTVRNNVTQDAGYTKSCGTLPFGAGLRCWGNASGLPGPGLFTGLDRDTESNLDHAGFRQYSPIKADGC
jgi:hypothetical protein